MTPFLNPLQESALEIGAGSDHSRDLCNPEPGAVQRHSGPNLQVPGALRASALDQGNGCSVVICELNTIALHTRIPKKALQGFRPGAAFDNHRDELLFPCPAALAPASAFNLSLYALVCAKYISNLLPTATAGLGFDDTIGHSTAVVKAMSTLVRCDSQMHSRNPLCFFQHFVALGRIALRLILLLTRRAETLGANDLIE